MTLTIWRIKGKKNQAPSEPVKTDAAEQNKSEKSGFKELLAKLLG